MRRLSTIGLLCGALLGLSGCYVAPGPAYYRPPVVSTGVYVAPRPYYPAYRPAYRPYGYGYGRYGYWR